jgi:large repetitive protein
MSSRKAKITKLKKVSYYSLSALVASFGLLFAFGASASAASLNQVMVRFDRLKVSTQTTGTVCAEPATANTEASVQVVFPTGYTLGAAGTFTVNTTNLAWPAGGTAWLGIGTATNVTSQTVTFPSSDLSVGTLYCFNWTNTAAVQVKSGATSSNVGTVTTRTSAPATIDTGDYSTVSISDDQITVSATVPQAFTFALSANSDALGNLSTGSVTTSPTPRTVTVNTNSGSGWMVWAKDTSTGLNSPSTGHTLASTTPGSNSTLSSGNEGYNFGVTGSQGGGTGTLSVAAPFVGTGAGQGGGLDTSFRLVTSSDGTANNAVLTLKNNAAISSTTAAATDYSDVITVVGAGLF